MICYYGKIRKLWIFFLFLIFFLLFVIMVSLNIYIINMNRIQEERHRLQRKYQQKKDTQVVVATYVGRPGGELTNLTESEINANNFEPEGNAGADGSPVYIPYKNYFIMQKKFKINKFNIMASDKIPLNRTLKDLRHPSCKTIKYPDILPTASVIIVFHNEAWSVLLRTVWSVLNRSPSKFLKEVILVDDGSDRVYLKEALADYIALHFKEKVFLRRLPTRKGLTPARSVGTKAARGDVIVFLDSHCECTTGWLEPLLTRIQENRKTVVAPLIDVLAFDTFAYSKVLGIVIGFFNWDLHFRWNKLLTIEDYTAPVSSPAMAGGLLAMDRRYFFEMGGYDDEMFIWGGENIEMSLRIWMCGGRNEVIPCSRVGHVFRKDSPHTIPVDKKDVILRNSVRLAKVWLDDYQYFFYNLNAISKGYWSGVNVTQRVKLREQLKCKNFQWYLDNVWQDNNQPTADKIFGQIVQLQKADDYLEGQSAENFYELKRLLEAGDFTKLYDSTHNCLENLENDTYMKKCTKGFKLQNYMYTESGSILNGNNACLNFIKTRRDTHIAEFLNCSKKKSWRYNLTGKQFVMEADGSTFCLTGSLKGNLTAEVCSANNYQQRFLIVPTEWRPSAKRPSN